MPRGPGRTTSPPVLDAANRLSQGLERRRLASGSLAFRDIGNGMTTDEEGRAVPSTWGGHWAERAVREFMILANATLAGLCAERDVPILFRNHRAKAVANRSTLIEDADMARSGLLALDVLAGRIALVTGRATLGPVVEGHWGLGLPAYAWFTSPIRRYADLVNQRNLEAMLDGREPPHDATSLSALGPALDILNWTDRDARSDSFKRSAERMGESVIRRGRASEVGTPGFTQVIKAATRGDLLDEDVLREAGRRMGAGELTVKDLVRLLTSGVPQAERMVVDHLLANPSVAVSLVDHAARGMGWTQVRYEEGASGPSHSPSFRARATVSGEGRTATSPECKATSSRDARRLACARAVAVLFGIDAPAPAPADGPSATAVPSEGRGNGKGRLIELCQARKWASPAFEVDRSGQPHIPTFSAVASVVTSKGRMSSAPATAPTRRDAEAAASWDLLAKLADG